MLAPLLLGLPTLVGAVGRVLVRNARTRRALGHVAERHGLEHDPWSADGRIDDVLVHLRLERGDPVGDREQDRLLVMGWSLTMLPQLLLAVEVPLPILLLLMTPEAVLMAAALAFWRWFRRRRTHLVAEVRLVVPETVRVVSTTLPERDGPLPVPTGAAAFDHRLRLQGPPSDVFRLAHVDVRNALLHTFTRDSRIQDGRWVQRLPHGSPRAVDGHLEALLTALRSLSQQLARHVDEPDQAVLDTILHDPNPDVRWRALDAMLQYAPEDLTTLDAVHALLGDLRYDPKGLIALVRDGSRTEQVAALWRLDLEGSPVPMDLLQTLDAPEDSFLDVLRFRVLRRQRARLGPVDGGRLTLTEATQGGELSVPSPNPAGRLSEPDQT